MVENFKPLARENPQEKQPSLRRQILRLEKEIADLEKIQTDIPDYRRSGFSKGKLKNLSLLSQKLKDLRIQLNALLEQKANEKIKHKYREVMGEMIANRDFLSVFNVLERYLFYNQYLKDDEAEDFQNFAYSSESAETEKFRFMVDWRAVFGEQGVQKLLKMLGIDEATLEKMTVLDFTVLLWKKDREFSQGKRWSMKMNNLLGKSVAKSQEVWFGKDYVEKSETAYLTLGVYRLDRYLNQIFEKTGALPEVIVYPDTSARPFHYIINPLLKKVYQEKGQARPQEIFMPTFRDLFPDKNHSLGDLRIQKDILQKQLLNLKSQKNKISAELRNCRSREQRQVLSSKLQTVSDELVNLEKENSQVTESFEQAMSAKQLYEKHRDLRTQKKKIITDLEKGNSSVMVTEFLKRELATLENEIKILEDQSVLSLLEQRFLPYKDQIFKDKRVLVVDDLIASGNTMEMALKILGKMGNKSSHLFSFCYFIGNDEGETIGNFPVGSYDVFRDQVYGSTEQIENVNSLLSYYTNFKINAAALEDVWSEVNFNGFSWRFHNKDIKGLKKTHDSAVAVPIKDRDFAARKALIQKWKAIGDSSLKYTEYRKSQERD